MRALCELLKCVHCSCKYKYSDLIRIDVQQDLYKLVCPHCKHDNESVVGTEASMRSWLKEKRG